jgi:hypothetical protein
MWLTSLFRHPKSSLPRAGGVPGCVRRSHRTHRLLLEPLEARCLLSGTINLELDAQTDVPNRAIPPLKVVIGPGFFWIGLVDNLWSSVSTSSGPSSRYARTKGFTAQPAAEADAVFAAGTLASLPQAAGPAAAAAAAVLPAAVADLAPAIASAPVQDPIAARS